MVSSENSGEGGRNGIAGWGVWEAGVGRRFPGQVVRGPADPPPRVDLAEARTVGRRRVGNVGALVWVAEQLDVVGIINRACGWSGGPQAVSIGEMALAIAVQRACEPVAKRPLTALLDWSVP